MFLVQSIQNNYRPNQPLCSGARSKGHEVNHSPPYSMEVNNNRFYTSTIPHMHLQYAEGMNNHIFNAFQDIKNARRGQ